VKTKKPGREHRSRRELKKKANHISILSFSVLYQGKYWFCPAEENCAAPD